MFLKIEKEYFDNKWLKTSFIEKKMYSGEHLNSTREFYRKICAFVHPSIMSMSACFQINPETFIDSYKVGIGLTNSAFILFFELYPDSIKKRYKKRLFEQVERLLEEYPQGCLLVEGDVGHELAYITNPRVFWGALAKLIISFSVPTVFTLDETQTAHFLISLASKLQEEGREEVEARYKPKLYSLAYRQRFVVQGLPGIGPKLADRLLKTFGSVRGVFMASESMLTRVKGFGRKRAKEITLLLDAPYEGATKKLA